jgi:putative ABC transport system substrate-binding protein
MPVVGFIDASSAQVSADAIATFRKGLEEGGFVQGRNVAFEFRHADNKIERLPELAADLVRRRVAVFAALNLQAALAARVADPTIPMVFHTGGDPVQTGLVASLDRPGGNITAVNSMNNGLLAKRLGLLHEMVPRAKRFAVLTSRFIAARDAGPVDELVAGASVLGLQVNVFTVSNGHDIDLAFATLDQKPVDALIFNSGPLFRDRRVPDRHLSGAPSSACQLCISR